MSLYSDNSNILKVTFKGLPTQIDGPYDELRYWSPKFSTCLRELQLPIWPENKTAEEFSEMMSRSVEANMHSMTET
jgi:hypothetical protein